MQWRMLLCCFKPRVKQSLVTLNRQRVLLPSWNIMALHYGLYSSQKYFYGRWLINYRKLFQKNEKRYLSNWMKPMIRCFPCGTIPPREDLCTFECIPDIPEKLVMLVLVRSKTCKERNQHVEPVLQWKVWVIHIFGIGISYMRLLFSHVYQKCTVSCAFLLKFLHAAWCCSTVWSC